MDEKNWEATKRLFGEALAVPAAERDAWIERECADEEVRLELLALLAAHDEAGNGGDRPLEDGPGVTIDRYKLLQQIGEGGFGTVYMAQQTEPVERRVALKIIKAGLDTDQIIARFEAERQAIALMDHPNIARVLDAGATASGKPYFVMELVKGIPITEYCEQHRLSPDERLALFTQVCHGVQHAHQKGIIHRDLKPTNVLVAEYDNVPVPKIIDFGVAKATSHRLTDKTVFTEFGQLIGTIEYMSPEQAKLNQIDVDTRSDVYALGVMLYELLTGTTPFPRKRLASEAFDEVLRIIREEQPPKPSTRVTTLVGAESGEKRDPQSLTRMLRGDLDWIIMRSLDKERGRRYGSAGSFAEDIERYLAGEPVRARPPSASYKIRKFVRRHRGPVAAAALFVLMLILGLAGTSYGFTQALESKREAVSTRESQQKLTARIAMEQGLRLCEDGNVASGMLFLVRALEMAPPEATAMRRAIRLNLAAWRPRLNVLESVLEHESPVICVGYDPAGEHLVTGTADGVAHSWGVGNLTRPRATVKHGSDVHGVTFSADGSYALTTTLKSGAHFWNVRTGDPMRELHMDQDEEGPSFGAMDAAVRPPEDRQVVTGHRGGEIRIWDAETGSLLDELESQRHMVHSLDVSADGKLLVTACHDGDTCVWDLDSKQLIARLRLGAQARVSGVAFLGSDGSRVVTGGSDGSVLLWKVADARAREDLTLDARKGETAAVLPPHAGAVHRLRASPNREKVLTASFDNTVRIIELDGDDVRQTVIDHPTSVQDAALRPDGSRVATASDDSLARIWRLAPPQRVGHRTVTENVQQAVFTADGKFMLTVSGTDVATVVDIESGAVVAEMPHEPGIRAMAVSADRSTCVTGSGEGQLSIWDIREGRFRAQVDGANSGFWSVAISPDGTQIAVGDFDKVLKVFDAQTGEKLGGPRPILRRVFCVAFSPDGSQLALGCDDHAAHLCDPRTLVSKSQLEGHRATVTVVAFSPDGKRLVTGGYDKTARVWDVETEQPITRPMKQSGTVFYVGLAFSPDGRFVAVGSEDGAARVWDVESATQVGPAYRQDSAACMVSFVDQNKLRVGSARGTLSTWSLVTEPIRGGVEHIRVWLESVTGLVLNEDAMVESLGVEEWSRRKKRLVALGGPPR